MSLSETILKKIELYIENKLEILKLDTAFQIKQLVVQLAGWSVVAVCLLCSFIMFSLALANAINAATQTSYAGYVAFGVFYLTLSTGIYIYLALKLKKKSKP